MSVPIAPALDPEVRAVLELVIKAGRPAYNTLSPKEARQLFRETRPASTPTPPAIGLVKDLAADGPLGPIPLRLYRPAGVEAAARLPVLVYFHGGGWVIGDLDTHDVLCRQLTSEAGVSVVSVDYRMAPEHKFPAAVDDSWAATRWVVGHADELKVDAARLAVAGDSAGGNLAAVVALLARDQGGPAIRLQVLNYPVTDCNMETGSYREFADGFLLTRVSMQWFFDHYFKTPADAADWRASPLRAPSLAGLPPALIITAGFDPLRDEGEAYAARLRQAGVSVDAVCFGGMIHGFLPMGRLISTANRAVSLVAGALRQALR
jgi:acetyl esterase/lipase